MLECLGKVYTTIMLHPWNKVQSFIEASRVSETKMWLRREEKMMKHYFSIFLNTSAKKLNEKSENIRGNFSLYPIFMITNRQ